MRRPYLQILIAISATWIASLSNAQSTDARAVLASSLAHFAGLKQYHADVADCYIFRSTTQCEEVKRKVMVGPDGGRIEQLTPVHVVTIMTDKVTWYYSPERQIYAERPFEPKVEPVEITSFQRLADRQPLSARFLPDETLSLANQEEKCSVIEATYRPKTTSPLVTVRLYVDRTNVPRRLVISSESQEVTYTVFAFDPNAFLPTDALVLPASAKKVTSFNLVVHK
jgi:outer membrane lipoprotein-sorting protein